MKKEDALTLVFLGRSGSGKDTQLELLARGYKPHLIINTGDLFRALVKSRGPFGKRIKQILDVGGLPPGWLASFLWLREMVEKLKDEQHLLEAGTPRRVEEAKLLDTVTEFLGRRKPIAIYIVVSEEVATQRLLARGRGDDTPEAIKSRLQYFKESVLPVVKYYQAKKRLIEVNGERSEEEIHLDIIKALKKFEEVRQS